MPESMFALGVFPFEELDSRIFVDGARDVPLLIVDARSEDILGEARADALGDLEGRCSGFVLFDGAVGESDINH